MRWDPRTFLIIVMLTCGALAGAPAVGPGSALAQAPDFFWAGSFGDASSQQLYDVAIDGDGNAIVTGFFQGSVDFGGGVMASAGGYDIFVAKFRPDGVHIWSKQFGDGDAQYGIAVGVDPNDNIILAGSFYGSVNFGPGPLTSVGNTDIYVAKLDADGAHIWSARYGDGSSQDPTDVAVGPDGSIAVAGTFTGNVNFGGGTLSGLIDGFAVVFDENGTHQWSRSYGSGAIVLDQANGVAIAADGNVAVAGDFQNSVDFGGGTLTSAGVSDIFVAVYDAAGTHLWSQRFGDASAQSASKVAFDSDGDVVLTGWFQGSVDFGGGVMTSAGSYDVFVTKLDTAGVHQWSHGYGDGDSQFGNNIAVDGNDRVILCGEFEGSMDLGGGTLIAADNDDAYLATFDASGTHLWSRRFGGAINQTCNAIGVDASNGITLGGEFQGSIDLGDGSRPSSGGFDAYVARYVYNIVPAINDVSDVPGDEGGAVNISWDASGADVGLSSDAAIDYYSVWRAISPEAVAALQVAAASLPPLREQQVDAATYYWFRVDSVDAMSLTEYTTPVSTLYDSISVSSETHYFQVIAHAGDPYMYYVSDPDSGYSVDNLAPGTPQGLAATQTGGSSLELVWQQNPETDLHYYAVYRGTDSAFVPGPGNRIDATEDTSSVDTNWQWTAGYYYKLSAVDIHGNESGFALLAPENVTHAGDPPRRSRSFLSRNVPNPFNPTTRIAFELDAPQNVTLAVYDARGVRVRTLASGPHRAARRYEITWDGRDDRGHPVASGVYFFRLSGDDLVRTRKGVLLK